MRNTKNPFERNLNKHLNYYVGVVLFYALINNTKGEGMMAFIILGFFAFLFYLLANTLPQANPKFIPTKRAGLVLYILRFFIEALLLFCCSLYLSKFKHLVSAWCKLWLYWNRIFS